jgi:DNA-binding NtrC family response regulator
LYFRLAVVPIVVPPLRERLEDVPLLVNHFANEAASRLGKEPCELSSDGLDLLCNYHWPGNVRELENLVTRASVLAADSTITADDLRLWLIDPTGRCCPPESTAAMNPASEAVGVGTRLEDMERRLIEATLEHYDGHRAKAAQALGIGIRTLTNKLRLYGYAPRARVFGKAA